MSDLEIAQEIYRECGFLVIACNYPHDIGEILSLEDDFLEELCRWRVISVSNVDEFKPQMRTPEALGRPFFYRCEATD